VLVDLFLRGMREPLPLYCRTSSAWAEAAALGKDPSTAAGAWGSEYGFDKEDRDPEHTLVLGEGLSFEAMVERAGAPCGDETGWETSEATRFGAYARRLWDGLLAHEQVVDQ
jgi:exodeoxyribonuclease V gamma subunit